MNSKTFSKKCNEKLAEIFRQAIHYEHEGIDDEDDDSYFGFQASIEDVKFQINKSVVTMSYPTKKYDHVEFDVDFDYTACNPKDVSKFILFGLSSNHVIEVDGRFFKIDNVRYIDAGDTMRVEATEVISAETTELPSGQKVFKPMNLPDFEETEKRR